MLKMGLIPCKYFRLPSLSFLPLYFYRKKRASLEAREKPIKIPPYNHEKHIAASALGILNANSNVHELMAEPMFVRIN